MSDADELLTDEEVRNAYQLGRSGCGCCAYLDDDDRDLFDAWLAARDAAIKAEALREAADALDGSRQLEGFHARQYGVTQWLRDRADALSGDESHGGDSGRDQTESASDRRTEALEGNQRLRERNMWALGYEVGHVAGQREERAREK